MIEFSDRVAHVVQAATTSILPILFAITLHEAAHALAAARLGDDTALRQGRVSLNPMRHIDIFGTVILPGLLLLFSSPMIFGWAKPVPVDFRRLRNPRYGMVLVAAAGPAMNIILAIFSALALYLTVYMPSFFSVWFRDNLIFSLKINVVLAVFNLFPIPPLDGGRILVGLLPKQMGRKLAELEPYGFLILIGLVFLLPMLFEMLRINFDPLDYLLVIPVELILDAITNLVGLG
ncbi:MAG: site-2 protease family protein [Alphaproteobacteria bacterium]|nr:site-2 protease family protein [Alphaproteobacteria bacterium]